MTEQTRVDPEALRVVGRVFGESARSMDLAKAALVDCAFDEHMGTRYGGHGANYAAGILAVSESMGRLAAASLQFGDDLTSSADTLSDQDTSNADAFEGNPGSGSSG
jgi:hypothetical protein